jgi:aspartyl/asparaginyl beta-hydroxylase (cupin superfamily)
VVDYHFFKRMLNKFLGHYIGVDRRPVFHDIATTYPALAQVTAGYFVIRDEFERLLREWTEFPLYHDLDAGEAKISNVTAKRWSVFLLELLGHRLNANRSCCPETCRILKRVPGLIQAFFSILDPGKSIPEHEGPYLGYLRYHLGLRVPKQQPPKLIVKGQDYHWKEGEGVLFDDSWPHSVVNRSPEMRAVLVIDVRRPLPWLPDMVNRFMTDIIAKHTYGRKVARKAEEFATTARRIAERRRAA